MRIAVDLSFIRPDHTNGGTESCIKNLMKGWIQQGVISDFLFFIHEDILRDYESMFPECVFLSYRTRGNHKMRTIWFQSCILPFWIKKYDVNILYYPTYTTGYYLNLSIPVIVNPHDLQFKFYPEYFSLFKKMYLDIGYRHSLKRADTIIAISDYVKKTLSEYYNKECKGKLLTIYDPIDFSQDVEVALNYVKEPYILSVSSIAKHKNMLTLIKAFEQICNKVPYNLVIVGCKGNGMEEVSDYLKGYNIESRVCFTDYVTDGNIEWLYRHASLYVTTSLYEGFGMTPIEAMGRGIPTICSRSTSLPEVTMDLAEYYEPAENEIVLAEKILEILMHKDDYIPNGAVFIEKYDKAVIAEKMYQLFEERS